MTRPVLRGAVVGLLMDFERAVRLPTADRPALERGRVALAGPAMVSPRPRWHDWFDTGIIAAILVVDTLWLVLR